MRQTVHAGSGAWRVPPVVWTAGLTVVVYGILGVVLAGTPPSTLDPTVARAVRLTPHVIAVVNTSALFCLLLGCRAIRARRVAVHRRYMLAAAACITTFLILYVTRVALGGTKAFPGPPELRRYVYLPMLTVHIVLSMLSVSPVIYNLLIGLSRDPAGIARTPHPRVGRVAVTLWSVSLLLGLGVYLMLNVLY